MKEYDFADLLQLKSSDPYSRKTVWLIAWIARVGNAPERTVDAGIYNEPSPTIRSSKSGETYRIAILAKAEGRDYEHAASKIHEAVDKDYRIRWVQDMPTYRQERRAAVVTIDLAGR